MTMMQVISRKRSRLTITNGPITERSEKQDDVVICAKMKEKKKKK